MEENNDFHQNSFLIEKNTNQLSIIDENPELNTIVEESQLYNNDENKISRKIILKLSKGYTYYTIIKIISYSINETSFILPYCLKKLGIIPFFLFLIFVSITSLYIFYLLVDLIIKYKLSFNYHIVIEDNTNRIYNIIYHSLNITYHFLILIFENYIFLNLVRQIFIFFNLNIDNIFNKNIIILSISLILLQFPFSFLKIFKNPDLIYIINTFLSIILNFVSLLIVIIYQKRNNNKEEIKLKRINVFENFSKDYFICFSIIETIICWQNQFCKHLEDFKIKTPKRFYNVIYMSFFFQYIIIILNTFIKAPLLDNKIDNIIFLLDYNNLNIISLIFIQIITLIYGLLIHIIIAYHMHLIQDNIFLIFGLTFFHKKRDNFKVSKVFIFFSNFLVLFFSNLICLFVDDIFIIVTLYGGIFSSFINYLSPCIVYSMMISNNSVAIFIAWIINLIIISLSILSFLFNVLNK